MQTARDFHPEVMKLFDQYVHGGLASRLSIRLVNMLQV